MKIRIDVSELKYLFLLFLGLNLEPADCFLLISIISSLHFGLLDQHLLFDLVDLLLLLNLKLVYDSPIFFSELLDIVHQLFIGLLRLAILTFISVALFSKFSD